MIQDIGEHKWDIVYRDNKPRQESRVMAFCKGKLLVKSQEGEINSRKRRYSKRHMRKVANKLFRYALASDRVKKKHVRRIQKLYR